MADIPASTWSQTDASNTTAAPDGAPEGMAPSGVNDVMRMMMGAVKRWYAWSVPATTGGTTTAYTLTYTVAPSALVDGMKHVVLFNATNGSSPTLNINGLGAKPLYKYSGGAWGAVASGDITANQICVVSYNSGEGSYRILSAATTSIGAAFLSVANAFTGNNTFAGTSTFSGTVTMSGVALNEAARVDVASASTCDIGAAASNYVRITGTTTITGLGTVASGTRRHVVFGGALTLTYNATSLILPSAASITTAAGDTATFESEGSGNWRCISYQKADGTAVVATTIPAGTSPIAYAYCTVSGGTVTLASSSNITSITKSSAGEFVVTMTSAASNTNYRILATPNFGAASIISAGESTTTQARTTTLFGLIFFNTAVSRTDPNSFTLTVYA